MAGTREELRQKEKDLKEKIDSVPDKYKRTWERELKYVKKQLYGHS